MPPRHLFVWLNHRDMVQLAKLCIDLPDNNVVHVDGMSGNAHNCWKKTARRLGYVPENEARREPRTHQATEVPRPAVAISQEAAL